MDYFPSCEIITSSASGGADDADDFRDVTPIGVAHAMRSVVKHYVDRGKKNEMTGFGLSPTPARVVDRLEDDGDSICDEEALDAIRI